jgi:hypothetical protein
MAVTITIAAMYPSQDTTPTRRPTPNPFTK